MAGACLGACRGNPSPLPLRLGTTTTVEQSGALALVDSFWHGAPLSVVIGPSGQILHAAAAGDLDLVITHAPALEARFLGGPESSAALRCPWIASRFAVVGPPNDPASAAGATSASDAFRRIARAGATFVSRGDSSGTHVKELEIWRRADVDPRGARWYVESGAGQTATFQIADQRGGYALADLPTFAHIQGLALRVLFTGDTALSNPYTLYVVRHTPEHPSARAFAAWAMGPWRERLGTIRMSDGTPAFIPRAGACTASLPDAPARATVAPASQQPALPGLWEYVNAAARPPRNPVVGAGPQVTLEIDSATGTQVSGRVARWLAGDVMLRPGTFGRITGRIQGDTVTLEIPYARGGAAPLTIRSRLAGSDTLEVLTSARGSEVGTFAPGARFVRSHRQPTAKP